MDPRARFGSILLLWSIAGLAHAATPSPVISPPTTSPSPSSGGGVSSPPVPTPTRIATASPVRPSPSPTRAHVASPPAVAPEAATVPAVPLQSAATAAPGAPRAYRTPERAASQPFVAPQAPAPASDDGLAAATVPAPPVAGGGGAAARGGSALVVFRATARTALEGFDLRIGYPRAAGSFGTGARPAECDAGTGMLVAANDRGTGELRLLVASAQALPFPLDVFCRFGAEPGAGIAADDLTVRVAEVTSDGKRADPSLLLVSVVVR